MKLKKFMKNVCAFVTAASILAVAAYADSDSFSGKAGEVPVSGTLSVTRYEVIATTAMGDNPAKYDVFQASISLTYIEENDTTGMRTSTSHTTTWSTGGNGYSRSHTAGYHYVSARSHCQYDINNLLYGSAEYDLSVIA